MNSYELPVTKRRVESDDFWNEVEKRVEENREIVRGGMPASLARVMEWIGLRFWLVGMSLSFLVTIWLWLLNRATLLRVVRVMIWR